MADLYVSWSEYHQKIEQLAVKVHRSGWQFEQVLCLSRGGLRVGDTLSRIFRKPLAILATASYDAAGGQEERGSLIISGHVTMTTEMLNVPLLVVDDLVDSGITLRETIPWLAQHHQIEPNQTKTAVLWRKGCSVFAPDFYVDFLPDNPWIHQPFECYEQLSLSELASPELILQPLSQLSH